MLNRFFVYALCVALLNVASPQAAQAALVGTLQAVEASSTRAQDMAIVNSALARERVDAGNAEPFQQALPAAGSRPRLRRRLGRLQRERYNAASR